MTKEMFKKKLQMKRRMRNRKRIFSIVIYILITIFFIIGFLYGCDKEMKIQEIKNEHYIYSAIVNGTLNADVLKN